MKTSMFFAALAVASGVFAAPSSQSTQATAAPAAANAGQAANKGQFYPYGPGIYPAYSPYGYPGAYYPYGYPAYTYTYPTYHYTYTYPIPAGPSTGAPTTAGSPPGSTQWAAPQPAGPTAPGTPSFQQ